MIFTSASVAGSENPQHRKEVILEIELNGKVRFDRVLNDIYHELGIMYKIVSAEVEFLGDCNFGQLRLLILVNSSEQKILNSFLNERRLLNTAVEQINRKAV